MHPVLEALQFLSDTPLKVISTTPGRATATGRVNDGILAHLNQLAELDGVRDLEFELVELAVGWSVHRVEHIGAIVSCTSFGGLLIQQVPDTQAFAELYLNDPTD